MVSLAMKSPTLGRSAGSSGSENVAGENTNRHTLTGLTNGRIYTISIVATSSTDLVSESVATNTVRLVPSALVLQTSPTVTSTNITITGSVPTGSVVTGFIVQWQRDTSVGCSSSNQRILTVNQGFSGSYRITGLEPGNRYTITVTVFNAAGNGPVSNAVTATTMETNPTGGPSSVRIGTVTASSITLHWGEVSCLHRNGEITGYRAQAVRNGMVEGTASVSGGARQATISGLSPSTLYSVQVAAVNGAGTGPYSGAYVRTNDGLITQVISSYTSLNISCTLEGTLTATGYTISYSNTNTDCFTDSRSGITTSGTSYTLTGLEEGTQYSITLNATLTGGRTE
ncbi:Receptor-type tyrosine-protein phosphatase delta, partial [Geodia barretti]